MHGFTQFGQLGVGYTNQKEVLIPQKVEIKVQLVSITCGAGHSLGLSKFGKVYSWGLNVLGQLGHGDTDTRW